MANFKLYNSEGKSLGEAKASDKVFSVPAKQHVVNTILTWYLSKVRQGTASAKTRAEVSGGGKKPWRQKGTGRARVGDNRTPVWVKGGVVFPPKPKDFSFNPPKKMRKLSIKMVLSDKAKNGKVKIVEALDAIEPKTKEFVKLCNKLKIKDSALFVNDSQNENVIRASRNIPNVKVLNIAHLNVYDLLRHDELILTKGSVSGLEEILK